MALLAEFSASTIMSRSSPLSTSDLPPIYISAIFDYNRARRSLWTDCKCFDSSLVMVLRICSIRSLRASSVKLPPTICVKSASVLIILADPKCFNYTSSIFSPYSLSISVAPVMTAMSLRISFCMSAIQGTLIAQQGTSSF